MQNNRPIHFEIQAENPERAKSFYEKVLGWKVEKYVPKDPTAFTMEYWMLSTGESNPGINGGMYKRPDKKEDQRNYYDMTISVPDIDEATKAVKANGGKVTQEKMEMKGLGFFAGVEDSEGNVFHLMQPTAWQAK
jgi:uncharacterized protein